MKDHIKKLEEIQGGNKKAFERIDEASRVGRAAAGVKNVAKSVVGKGQNTSPIIHRGGNQFSINGNPVEYMFLHASIESIVNSPNWNGPWKWLLDGKYSCRYLSLASNKIVFCGDWLDGDCKPNKFQDTISHISRFLGGRFLGGAYQAENNGYGKENVADHAPKVLPISFVSGTYKDNKEGIFGNKDLIETPTGYKGVELVKIPVGYYLVLNKGMRSEAGFQLTRRINEKDSIFSFNIFPKESSASLKWDTIRNNFAAYNFIQVGKSYELPGIIKIKKINSIHVQQIHQYVKQNVYVFPLKKSPELARMKLGINLNIPTIQGKLHRQSIDTYQKDLFDNVIPGMLKRLKESGVDGYYAHDSLKSLFNNQPGAKERVDGKTMELLNYLAGFFDYVVNWSNEKDRFTIALRNYLEIPEASQQNMVPDVTQTAQGTSTEDELAKQYAEKEKLKKSGKLKQ